MVDENDEEELEGDDLVEDEDPSLVSGYSFFDSVSGCFGSELGWVGPCSDVFSSFGM